MIEILIIADDFTGALDTGVQFASVGIETLVRADDGRGFGGIGEEEAQILVLDMETRHLKPEEAYRAVFDIAKKAVESGVRHIYKKTDSALRGNIGSELTALLDASPCQTLPFIPALPSMNRVTKCGIHYIDGKPMQDSVFGLDPFEPVSCSYIPDIIGLQSGVKTCVIGEDEERKNEGNAKEIHIYDVETEKQLKKIAERLLKKEELTIMAGCKGFASVLPALFQMENRKKEATFPGRGLLVVNGSLNPISASQLDYAQAYVGFYRVILSPEQKLDTDYWEKTKGLSEKASILEKCIEHNCLIIDGRDEGGSNLTNIYAAEHGIKADSVRERITVSLGRLVRYLIKNKMQRTLMIIGGDTLKGVLKELDVCEIQPICEIFSGTVLSSFSFQGEKYQLISKSGGFGSCTLLRDILEIVLTENGKEKEHV